MMLVLEVEWQSSFIGLLAVSFQHNIACHFTFDIVWLMVEY